MPLKDTTEDLNREVHLLRRRVRLLIAAVIVITSLLLMGAAFQHPDRLLGLRTIEANEFVLRDANGQARARLEVTLSGLRSCFSTRRATASRQFLLIRG